MEICGNSVQSACGSAACFFAEYIESVLQTNCLDVSEKSASSYFHRLTVPVFHNSRADRRGRIDLSDLLDSVRPAFLLMLLE